MDANASCGLNVHVITLSLWLLERAREARGHHLQPAPRRHVAARPIVRADGVKVLHPGLYDGLNQFS